MSSAASNRYKYVLLQNVFSHQFIACLMNETFLFDKDAHEEWSDASESELSSPAYTGGVSVQCQGVEQFNDYDKATLTFGNISFTGDGGDIGPSIGIIIYDSSIQGNPIVGFIDFVAPITDSSIVSMGVKFDIQ